MHISQPFEPYKPISLSISVTFPGYENLPHVSHLLEVNPQIFFCCIFGESSEVERSYIILVSPICSHVAMMVSYVFPVDVQARALRRFLSAALSSLSSTPNSLPPTISLSTVSLSQRKNIAKVFIILFEICCACKCTNRYVFFNLHVYYFWTKISLVFEF